MFLNWVLLILFVEVGEKYSLLRFNNVSSIPADSSFLNSQYDVKYDFVASENTMKVPDPKGIMSDQSASYFAVKQ